MDGSPDSGKRTFLKPPTWRNIRLRVSREILEGCRNGAAARVYALETLMKSEKIDPNEIGTSDEELSEFRLRASEVEHNPITPL